MGGDSVKVASIGDAYVQENGIIRLGNGWLIGRLTDDVTFECVEENARPSQLERELVTMLSDYVSETGESESAVEVLSRLLTELEDYRKGNG